MVSNKYFDYFYLLPMFVSIPRLIALMVFTKHKIESPIYSKIHEAKNWDINASIPEEERNPKITLAKIYKDEKYIEEAENFINETWKQN